MTSIARSFAFLLFQVRVENIKDPSDHISAVLERVRPEYLQRTYQVSGWMDSVDFLEKVAGKTGRLLKVPHYFISV